MNTIILYSLQAPERSVHYTVNAITAQTIQWRMKDSFKEGRSRGGGKGQGRREERRAQQSPGENTMTSENKV